MKITPKAYLHGFAILVMALGILRLTTDIENFTWESLTHFGSDEKVENDTIVKTDSTTIKPAYVYVPSRKPNRILSVPNYDTAFPDANDVQLVAAEKHGVSPVANREEAEHSKGKLVYVGANPYFQIDRLRSSIPYLVPKASILLQDIGRIYLDSLEMKGVPSHKIIATSILRTKEDVEKLRRHNPNATENSCHLYGTTFDIAQNRFVTVEDPDGPKRRQVTNDTLKWVLTEVLRDMREQGRCYVKYEKKQGCFHITVR